MSLIHDIVKVLDDDLGVKTLVIFINIHIHRE